MNKASKITLWIGLLLTATITLFEITFWFGTPPSTVSSEVQYVNLNGQKVAYSVQGNGPVIVLLHSGAWSGIEYRALSKKLSDQYTVYVIDLPGFGYSDKPQVTYSLDYLTAQMIMFFEQFPEERFHLVGASIGGSIATQVAAELPDRVRSLTLIDPFGFGNEINQTAIIAQVPVLAEAVLSPNHVVFEYVLDHGLLSPDSLAEEYRAELFAMSQLPKAQRAKLSVLRSTITMQGVHPNVQESMHQAAIQVQQPVLLLWGENDIYAPVQQHETVLTYMPQARYKELLQAGHFAHMEVPDDIADTMINFYENQFEE